jgi:hypothetical protein
MAVPENDSISGLVRSVLADTRELVRDELDLMRAEVREEVMSARAGAMALGGAAFAGLLGLALFCVALGSAIAYWAGWPVWAGYAIVSLLLFVGAYVAMVYGRKRLSNVGALPKTRATLKENFTWIQSKSAPK